MSKSIDEQLAELCGFHYNEFGVLVDSDDKDPLGGWFDSYEEFHQNKWNPTTDLNQLKMCYDAAEKAVGAWAVQHHIKELLGESGEVYRPELLIFTRPELVAQAILKAKGVS